MGSTQQTSPPRYKRLAEAGSMAGSPVSRPSSGTRYLAALAAVAVGTMLLLVLWQAGSSVSGRQSNQGHAATGLQLPSASDGICRHTYSVPTWNGEAAAVCDTSICQGAEKLRLLPVPAAKQRRWSAFDEATYFNLFRGQQIGGWLQEPQVHYVRLFSELQHSLGIYGAVGEIGVHHGKFLMPIAGYASRSEPAVAMDLFENQAANFDQSGRGSTSFLLKNLETVGIPEADIQLIAGNSMHLTAANISSRQLPAFRMFSVDGGHSLETTLHDMMLASCLLRDGGIMILDDVLHHTWLGVSEAMLHFSFANKRMVPFLMGYNKAYFTTASHVPLYQQFMANNNATFTCRTLHGSRHAMAGNVLCYSGPQAA